ncbi:MAG: aminopeptidase [Armatimonadetes bacterium]|nr:aminopeptidase [Armatimonadota bacterium]
MFDPRMKKLADVLVGYSAKVRPGDRVLINAFDVPSEMVTVLIDRITEAGGLPFANTNEMRVLRAIHINATEEQMKIMGRADLEFMKQMNCYIALRGGQNITELSDVPEDKMKIAQEHWEKPVLDYRVKHTRWVVLRWPSPSMAQQAGMSTDAFEDFYFDVCTLDYAKMAAAERPLKERMDRTDRVRIVGPQDTDLEFSIKGIPAVMCVGDRNIPDGEVFTAPVRESINGVIHFNTGTIYHGKPFDNIRLVFENGKIVEATGSDTKGINEILDTDEGARYVGEFSLGFNPHIRTAMRDILFDEKINGSIHLTPGEAYDEADNGNQSKIHWDMVLIQTEDCGGGEIHFDDELIRKDGRFVPEYLQGLNPENLTSTG